jgi:hypothetical protein
VDRDSRVSPEKRRTSTSGAGVRGSAHGSPRGAQPTPPQERSRAAGDGAAAVAAAYRTYSRVAVAVTAVMLVLYAVVIALREVLVK